LVKKAPFRVRLSLEIEQRGVRCRLIEI